MPEPLPIRANVRWLAVGHLAVKPLWFLFLLVSSRLLGPEEFGRYMFALSFVSVVAIFFEGGIDIHIVRQLSARREEFARAFAHSSFLKILSALAFGLASWGLTFVVPVPAGSRVVIVLAAAYLAFNLFMLHFRAVFRAFEIMNYEAISMIVEKMAVMLLCGAVLLVRPDSTTFMSGYALAYLGACAVTLAFLTRTIGRPDWNIDARYLWTEVLKPALPFALMNVFMMIYFRSGTLMIRWLTGREDLVGFYNAGYRLVESYMLFPAIITTPIYPVLVRLAGDRTATSRLTLEAARAILFISMLVTVPLFLFHREFTRLFFGPAYAGAALTVGIVAITMIPIGLNFVFGTLVAAVGRQPRANVFIVAVTAVNLVANYVLISAYGIAGAAATTVLTEGLLAAANLWVVRDHVRWGALWSLLLRVALPVVAVGLLFRMPVLDVVPLFVKLGAVLLLLGLSGLLLRLVSLADARRLLGAR